MLNKIAQWRAANRYRNEDQRFLSDVNAANLYELPLQSHLILWISLVFVLNCSHEACVPSLVLSLT